ncbi:conserved hypothetical protein [Verticillium alfalfae VaMs.102]|uniref:Uncharacterized protein n=1 Tax=Verticillium alfalfae (strain VaMs.102 / ATCC MYA-4576 / FGSC 10136) TaxID=526221 RepID=C9SXL4_VERA1|nr:conserved hypothetical protein [Verticillium alfalfae VaMs.102]EEY23404.1 conserved hypothetical protein [Verticillium alfalfae VaMs.102]
MTGLAGIRDVKYGLASIYASIALILVRTVYRTAEHYAMEELDGKQIRDSADIPVMVRYEVFCCVFGAAFTLVLLVIWNVLHTRWCLPVDNKMYIARDGVRKVKGLGWQVRRSRSARVMNPSDRMGMCGRRQREKCELECM